MKRFLWKLALIAPIGLVLLGVNVLVDPANLFFHHDEQQIAAWMLAGQNVANAFNVDDRQVLRHYVASLPAPKDVLVFGSSRTMVIDSSFFPGQTMFNASCPAATLPDLLANYQMFYDQRLLPKRIVIGVDAHIFNPGYSSTLNLSEEYHRATQRLGLTYKDSRPVLARFVDRRYAQLLSPAYFQSAVELLPALIKYGRPAPYATQDEQALHKLVRADGSLAYEERRRAQKQTDIDRKAGRYIEKHPEELTGFRGLGPDLKRAFEAFVLSAQHDGVQVTLLLLPFHPAAYDRMMAMDAYRVVADVEQYVHAFANAHGITLDGSYDPAQCGFANTDFYDAVHSKPEAIHTLFGQKRDAGGVNKQG